MVTVGCSQVDSAIFDGIDLEEDQVSVVAPTTVSFPGEFVKRVMKSEVDQYVKHAEKRIAVGLSSESMTVGLRFYPYTLSTRLHCP